MSVHLPHLKGYSTFSKGVIVHAPLGLSALKLKKKTTILQVDLLSLDIYFPVLNRRDQCSNPVNVENDYVLSACYFLSMLSCRQFGFGLFLHEQIQLFKFSANRSYIP